MSHSDRVFKFPERASYEFGYLLRSLPQHLNGEKLSEQQLLEVEAADLHALNASGTLLHGLQALGRVMRSAGANEEFQVDGDDYGHVGALVTEISLQLQFLMEFRESVAEQEIRRLTAPPARRGGA